jgi:hypothetical protein
VIQPVAAEEVTLVLRKDSAANVTLEYRIPPTVEGPLLVGSPIGKVLVRQNGELLSEVAALCPIEVVAPPTRFGPSFTGYSAPGHFDRYQGAR